MASVITESIHPFNLRFGDFPAEPAPPARSIEAPAAPETPMPAAAGVDIDALLKQIQDEKATQAQQGVPAPGAAPGPAPAPGPAQPEQPEPTVDIDKLLTQVQDEKKSQSQGTLQNYIGGAVDRLSDLIDLGYRTSPLSGEGIPAPAAIAGGPPGLLANAMVVIGKRLLSGQSTPPPDRVAASLVKYLEAQGVPVKPAYDSMAGDIGKETVDALLTLGVFRAAAVPALMTLQGGNAISRFAKRSAEYIYAHPILTATIDVAGTVPGMVTARRVAQNQELGGLATFGAELGGALAGGGLASGALSGGRRVGGALATKVAAGLQRLEETMLGRPNVAIRAARGQPTAPATDALREASYDPRTAQVAAEQAVAGDLLRIENTIVRTVQSVARPGMSRAELNERVTQGLSRAEDLSQKVVSDYWNRVDIKRVVNPIPIDEEVVRLQRQLVDRPASAPTDFMDEIRNVGYDGTSPTIERYRDIRGAIYRARKSEEANLAPNREKIANFHKLEGIIDNGIANMFPGDTRLQQARLMSTRHYDMFGRGVIPDILARTRRGEFAVRPTSSVDEILSSFEGLQDVLTMTQRMTMTRGVPPPAPPGSRPPSPTAYKLNQGFGGPTLTYFRSGGAEQETFASIRRNIEADIRAQFREEADRLAVDAATGIPDPKRVAAYLAKMEPKVEPLARVQQEFHTVYDRMRYLEQERRLIENSALARFSQRDPEVAIQRLFSSPNPAVEADALIRGRVETVFGRAMRTPGLQGDADAMNGLRAGILDQVFLRSRGDPSLFHDMVFEPKMRRLLETVFDAPQLARLDKIAGIANALHQGDIQSWGLRHIYGLRTMFAIVGAWVGREVGHVAGSSTIQIPGRTSNYFQRLAVRWFAPDDAPMLMKNAILDPTWEAVLMKRVPVSTKDAHAQLKAMRRALAGMEATREAVAPDERPL